jgi:hypothetical protein
MDTPNSISGWWTWLVQGHRYNKWPSWRKGKLKKKTETEYLSVTTFTPQASQQLVELTTQHASIEATINFFANIAAVRRLTLCGNRQGLAITEEGTSSNRQRNENSVAPLSTFRTTSLSSQQIG